MSFPSLLLLTNLTRLKVCIVGSRETHLTATGRHLPYQITELRARLPPDTSERSPTYPSQLAGTRFTYPRGMEG